MKKRQRNLIIAGAAVLVVAGGAVFAAPTIYRALFASEAADAPTISTDSSTLEAANGEALEAVDLAGDWTITDGSEAGYRVDEVLSGEDVTVTGRTSDVEGTIKISDDGLTLEQAEISLDVASIATDSNQRDEYFRSQAINTDEYPTATFALTDPVEFDSIPTSGEVVTVPITGTLTIAGQSQEVSVDVEVASDGTTTELAGSIPVTFADFGVDAPSMGFVEVEDEGFVEFQLVATR